MTPAFPPGLGGSLPSAYQFVRDPQSGQLVVIPSDHLPHFGKWWSVVGGRAVMASYSETVQTPWASRGGEGVSTLQNGVGVSRSHKGPCSDEFLPRKPMWRT